MDATASREPSWDRACQLQGQMFQETAQLGGLDVSLCFFRGFREFQSTPWVHDAKALLHAMSSVRCAGGLTQIDRVLNHAIAQTKRQRINALVLVGDVVEESADGLCHLAGELGLLGVPMFVFQEGVEAQSKRTFEEMARISRGAYSAFDLASATQLRDLLRAVAIYAAGGLKALESFEGSSGRPLRLTHQLK